MDTGSHFKSKTVTDLLREYLAIIFLAAVSIIFTVIQPRFATFYNLSTILMQTSLLAIISIGLTFVMIINEFDLSFPFLASLGVNTAVNIAQLAVPGFLAILVPLLVGLFVGLVNGLIVSKLKTNSFIATLGMGTILLGVNFLISGGKTIVVVGGLPDWFIFPAQEQLLGFSYLTYIMVAVLLISIIVIKYTVFGRIMYAIGGNADACIVSGINVEKRKIFGFIISGFLAGLTGFLLAARLEGGHPNAGDEFLMTGFAAVFLGMTLKSGLPNILGTFFGAFFIVTIWNGITLIWLPYEYQLILTALTIIIFASIGYGMKGKTVKV